MSLDISSNTSSLPKRETQTPPCNRPSRLEFAARQRASPSPWLPSCFCQCHLLAKAFHRACTMARCLASSVACSMQIYATRHPKLFCQRRNFLQRWQPTASSLFVCEDVPAEALQAVPHLCCKRELHLHATPVAASWKVRPGTSGTNQKQQNESHCLLVSHSKLSELVLVEMI